jgi:hypothetical protein
MLQPSRDRPPRHGSPSRRGRLNIVVIHAKARGGDRVNPMRRWIEYWNRKVKKFGIFEIKMAQGAAIGGTLVVVKLFPQILELSVWWFVALIVVCAVPVHYTLWCKKNGQSDSAPNGGPAKSVGHSGVTEGPPSVD